VIHETRYHAQEFTWQTIIGAISWRRLGYAVFATGSENTPGATIFIPKIASWANLAASGDTLAQPGNRHITGIVYARQE
jgi:hypothetical protein